MKRIPVLVSLILFVFVQTSVAGVTGKIAGRVTDAETGEPLVGVNVIVEGLTIGAAADMNGYYVILNVPPGKFTLKASMIGYKPYIYKDVSVRIDLTSTINFPMRSEVLDMDEVVVVAERPIVTPDVSASEAYIEPATIERLPVQTLAEVISLQAGVEETNDGLRIRGGDINETGFLLDGFATNDERTNIPVTVLSTSSIKESKFQTGGFNAEYGNIRSGQINVVTKDGDRLKYNLTFSGQYRPPDPKHFGPSIYDPNTYFTRPYTDPTVCWTGTANGAWDDYTQRQYPIFEGWNALSDATMQDNDPGNDLTPEGARRLWEWQHRRQGDITKPDFIVDAGFGGPVPFIGDMAGDLRFFLSHFREREMFVFPLSRDAYEDNSTQLKLSSDLSSSIKLVLTGVYDETHSVSPYNWTTTPTGDVLRFPAEIGDQVNSSSGDAMLYVPGHFSPGSIYRNMVGLKLIHTLGSKTFYEVYVQHNINRYNTFQIRERDTSKVYQPVPGYFVDEAPEGYWGYGVSGIDGMILGGWMNIGRDKSINSTTRFRFDFTSQLDGINQAKTGFEIVYNDFNIRSYAENPGMSTWNRSQEYNRFPYRVGFYLQDKLEFEQFIANLGLRLDYSSANGSRYQLTPYDSYYKEGFGDAIEEEAPTTAATSNWYLSPRLGVSHPITVNSKLYFNYGHFMQEASSTYRFRLQREANGLVTSIGNPDLDLQRTIAYELGYEHNISDMFLLNLAAYYKDITDQPGWVYYQNINRSVQYNIATNNNYEDIRGFEFTITKLMGAWLSGFVNYTYEVSTLGYFGLTNYYEDPNEQRTYLRLNPTQDKPHPRPYARANINLHTPRNFGPDILGHKILSDWNLSVLASWKAGAYDTYNPNLIPGLVNNVRWKDRHNIDLRLSKTVKINRLELQFYADVTNVLNTKQLSYAGFADNIDYYDYLESLHFSWESGAQYGHDKIGDFRKEGVPYEPYDPTDLTKTADDLKRILETKAYIDMPNFTYFTFFNPRDVTFGVRINF